MRKRIICLISQYAGDSSNGVGTYTNKLIKALNKNKYFVILITSSEIKENKNLIVFRVPSNYLGHAGFIPFSYRASKIYKNIKDIYKINLLHFTDAKESLFFIKDNSPIIGTIHDYHGAIATINPLRYIKIYSDWTYRWIYYNFLRALEKRTLNKMDSLIFVSKFTQKKILKNYDIKKDSSVIYNGIGRKYGSNFYKKKKNQILFVGGNFDGKGLRILIEAAKLLDKKIKCNYIVVGNDKKMSYYLKLIKKYKLTERFEFIKKIKNEDLKKYYSESPIFVLPSFVDSTPFSILEAMINRCAIISTKVGGIPEMVDKSGIILDEGDFFSLSKNILALTKDKKLLKEFQNLAYKRADNFTDRTMLKEHLNIYKKYF